MAEDPSHQYSAILDEVCKVLDNLTSNAISRLEREEGSSWLREFSVTPVAWNVALDLLSSPKYCLQGTMMLTNKITNSWNTLQHQVKRQICDLVLLRLQSSSSMPAFRNALCQSLTLIILQSTPRDWPNPINDILFLAQPSSENDTRDCWTRLIRELADGVSKSHATISPHQIEEVRSYLKDQHSTPVISCLLEITEYAVSKPNTTLATDALETLQQWLALNPPVSELMLRIAEVATRVICQDPTTYSKECAEMLNELMLVSNLARYPSYLKTILEYVLSLQPIMETALRDVDSDVLENLICIFTSVGINHPAMLLRFPDYGVQLAHMVCQCSQVKSAITSECYEFWQELQQALSSESSEDVTEEFREIFEELVRILLFQAKYGMTDELDSDEQSEFDTFRSQAGDCLLQIYKAIPDEEIKLITDTATHYAQEYYLQQTWENESWLEVCLWAYKSLCDDPIEEEEWPAKVLNELIPNLPPTTIVQQMTLQLIEGLSSWFECHESSIPVALQYLTSTLTNPNMASASVSALNAICNDCSGKMLPFFEDLLNLVDPIMPSLSPPQQAVIISCLASQSSYLGHQDGFNILNKLAGSIPQETLTLSQSIPYSPESKQRIIDGVNFIIALMVTTEDSPEGEDSLLPSKRRLYLGRPRASKDEYYHNQLAWSANVVTPLLDATWPIIECIVSSEQLDEPLVGVVVKYFRRAIHSMKRYPFARWIERCLNILVTIFEKTQLRSPVELYDLLCGIYRSVYRQSDINLIIAPELSHMVELGIIPAQEPAAMHPFDEFPLSQIHIYFGNAFVSFSQAALQSMASAQSLVAELDILHSFFSCCVITTLRWCPRVFFFNNDCAVSICGFAVSVLIQAMRADEVRMMEHFFNELFNVPAETIVPSDTVESYHSFLINDVLFGVVRNVLLGVAGEAPISIIGALAPILKLCMDRFPTLFPEMLVTIMQDPILTKGLVDEESKRKWISQIMENRPKVGLLVKVLHELSCAWKGDNSSYIANLQMQTIHSLPSRQ